MQSPLWVSLKGLSGRAGEGKGRRKHRQGGTVLDGEGEARDLQKRAKAEGQVLVSDISRKLSLTSSFHYL